MLWPDSILAVPKEKIMDSQPMVLRMISLILHLLPIAIQTGKVRITVGRRNVRQVFISMAVMLMIIATCLILIIVVMARLCSARITVFGIHGLSGLIGIQLYFVAALQENGSADAAYYVGSVTTNLATDSISSFDPYTGKALDFFNIRYVFSMYPAANAVLCRLTGLHPLVVTKVILCMMTVVLSYLVYAQIGKALLKEKQMVWVLLCFISVVNLNFHTIFSNASFLLTRGYEGKAVLCNIILPFLFYLGLRMYQEKNGKRVWLLFFMTGVAAIDLTMSSMMTVPVAMSAVILPNLVRKKRWGQSRLYLLAVLPCVLVLGVYLLGVRGILQIPVVR